MAETAPGRPLGRKPRPLTSEEVNREQWELAARRQWLEKNQKQRPFLQDWEMGIPHGGVPPRELP